jgi:hypothetical protein
MRNRIFVRNAEEATIVAKEMAGQDIADIVITGTIAKKPARTLKTRRFGKPSMVLPSTSVRDIVNASPMQGESKMDMYERLAKKHKKFSKNSSLSGSTVG